jgi:CheY-like chemotaxis protein
MPSVARAQYPDGRVLVVDDVDVNRELFVALLGRHGLSVDTASSGQEAIAAVQARAYDLVLMDVQMPGLDGVEATRAIRAAGLTHLPILALSAADGPERVVQWLEAGMTDRLPKPVTPDALADALRRHLVGIAPTESRFEQENGAENALRLLKLFQAQLATRFQIDERSRLHADAHALAGTADMLGFAELAAASKALERACVLRHDVQKEHAAVLQAADEARRSLAAWIRRLERQARAA